MENYLTPNDVADALKVAVNEVIELVEQGKLRAIRIGGEIRVPEKNLSELETTCPVVGTGNPVAGNAVSDAKASDGVRFCPTRTGTAQFRVRGDLDSGIEIWPGKMQSPIRFSRQFFVDLFARYGGHEIPVGGQFDAPGIGSLGAFVQNKIGTKMNPAVYLAALLIDLGRAHTTKRGYIQLSSDQGTTQR